MALDGYQIDVFVLTFNRADLLSLTLQNLLQQTLQGARITVLDNASTDHTPLTVQPFEDAGVRYFRAEQNIGWAGNLAKAQQLSERAWTMVFHDDDLLHPDYLKLAADAINTCPNAVLVGAGMSFETSPSNEDWLPADNPGLEIYATPRPFAELLYDGFHIHFGSAIYKTSIFKEIQWDGAAFGKIADKPFLFSAASHGAALIFKYPFVKYRLHESQDSNAPESGPFVLQLAALHRLYRNIMGESIFSASGRTFLKKNYGYLQSEFDRLATKDRLQLPQLKRYLQLLREQQGTSLKSIMIGSIVWHCEKLQRTCMALLLRLKRALHL